MARPRLELGTPRFSGTAERRRCRRKSPQIGESAIERCSPPPRGYRRFRAGLGPHRAIEVLNAAAPRLARAGSRAAVSPTSVAASTYVWSVAPAVGAPDPPSLGRARTTRHDYWHPSGSRLSAASSARSAGSVVAFRAGGARLRAHDGAQGSPPPCAHRSATAARAAQTPRTPPGRRTTRSRTPAQVAPTKHGRLPAPGPSASQARNRVFKPYALHRSRLSGGRQPGARQA